MTVTEPPMTIDLLATTWGRGEPHDQFDWLRREAPVYWHDEPGDTGFWAVTRHADVRMISNDWETFSSELGATFIPTQEEEILAQLQLTILNMDPPRHNRARRLVSKAFTPKRIAQLVDEIERRAAAVVDAVIDKGECEFVEEIAAQVPVQMICEMIGLEPELWPHMFSVSNDLIGARDDPEYAHIDPEISSAEIFALCDAVAEDRRHNPRDDLMTALVEAELDGERLDNMELDLFFITLVVAGNETTRNLINLSTIALLEHPEQAQRLREDPSLWSTAVEEMLRWGSSIQNFRRTATRDTEISGVPIAAGDKVVMYYASANRDEDVFENPHVFDIARTPNDHVTFGGGGVHFCLGASLARAEIKATMRQVVERMPNLELVSEPERLVSDFVNGVKRMRVKW
ncbi:MAG: cytochrome P450 [Microthrixaceae bacterium]